MNIHLENVNLQSTSGPNHFANKLIKYLKKKEITFNEHQLPDVRLCFIESHRPVFDEVPLIQRLDGIYFNSVQDYELQNVKISDAPRSFDGTRAADAGGDGIDGKLRVF